MKQVFQDLRSGETLLLDVPVPSTPPGHLLVRTQASLISAGTERMLVDFGRSSYLDKARKQPEKVRQVLDKARTDGLLQTVDAVRSKLAEPLPLGYANAGVVVEVGSGVTGFEVGDPVASNGAHAEWVTVPATLATRVPTDAEGRLVPPEQAAFATVGAIAMESLRLASPAIGERFVVSGLGLVGLLTVQLLRAAGCRVLGLDFDRKRLDLAASFGAEVIDLGVGDALGATERSSLGRGVDGVIVAAATDSDEPVRAAAEMCRTRGRIVLVGVAGLDLDRTPFYEKELSFQVSCSYGPGRYDPAYESGLSDYPFGHVRWTAARNAEAFLDLVASGSVDVGPLVSHRFAIADAASAYGLLVSDQPSLAVTLQYPDGPAERDPSASSVTLPRRAARAASGGRLRVAVIGAGNYARRTLLPALADQPVELVAVAARSGAGPAVAAREFGAQRATTDVDAVLHADDVDAVFITTRHDSHAGLAVEALRAGKHVFVEKPLAISTDQLELVESALRDLGPDRPVLTVGFNRRFAPQVVAVKEQLRALGPVAVQMTVNAGPVPATSWLHDPEVGGGRIVGEACHFIDLARHLAGAPITSATSTFLGHQPTMDSAHLSLAFEDGSVATIAYLANGHASYPKERVEVFAGGRVYRIDNFRTLRTFGGSSLEPKRLRRQDKGHAAAIGAFLAAVSGDAPDPIPSGEILDVASVCVIGLQQRQG